MQTLLWTTLSLRDLAKALKKSRHKVSPTVVGQLLRELHYSLQANSKTQDGKQHIDRDAQFRYINTQATEFLTAGAPVISVDTKKKELVGNYKNNGRTWRPKGTPDPVNVHDFKDPNMPRAVPHGIYDLADNVGWVTVGTDHDTERSRRGRQSSLEPCTAGCWKPTLQPRKNVAAGAGGAGALGRARRNRKS